jgi:hypothetical protein
MSPAAEIAWYPEVLLSTKLSTALLAANFLKISAALLVDRGKQQKAHNNKFSTKR